MYADHNPEVNIYTYLVLLVALRYELTQCLGLGKSAVQADLYTRGRYTGRPMSVGSRNVHVQDTPQPSWPPTARSGAVKQAG
jgi:hypothetical protein